MDIVIQQDGRIQTNVVVPPDLRYYETAELVSPFPYAVGHQQEATYAVRMNIISRRFRKLGTEGKITVWVEVR